MRFEDLRVWQLAREFNKSVYESTRNMRDHSLRDQMRSAAVSVVSNIAEGNERGSAADFRRILIIARGSCGEVRAQAYVAEDVGEMTGAHASSIRETARKLGAMISAFAAKLAEPKPKAESR